MGSTFEELGRALGRVAIPALRRARLAWQTIAGSEADKLRAERELGRTLAQRVRASSCPASAADFDLVRGIGRGLVERLKNRELRFEFEVISSLEPWAVVLPGGYVFLSTSLLDL
ncbi:MAG: hypothetical protein N3G20_04085, partial [Verrucomicrobiae bacterium]|nr:hypothetical protein [Verrucomicrobiae bacterium]